MSERAEEHWREVIMEKPRPAFIKHWSEIQEPDNSFYPDSNELHSIGSPFGKFFGLKRIGIHHEVLKPGRRTSRPHAESSEDEFVYVIEGTPDAWINGEMYRLREGDAVGLPAGTGITHTFINNTDEDVRLMVIGERHADNKVYYPRNPEMISGREDWWHDWPQQEMGNHDGLPDKIRDELKKQP